MTPTAHAVALERACDLLERVLRPTQSAPRHALAREFPLVFDADSPGRIVALEHGGEVRSACAYLVRELVLPRARLRVGLIGSVATDANFRGRGFASSVLEEAHLCLAREGCLFAMLWADDAGFYTARGYQPIGSEVDFLLEDAEVRKLPRAPGIRSSGLDDASAIHRLYSRHPERVARAEPETAALLRCPEMTTLVLDRGRDIAAYACLGRGDDLASTVHEWGGSAADVAALIREHGTRLAAHAGVPAIAVMTPPSAHELHALLRATGAREARGVLGLAKALDVEPWAEVFCRAAPSDATAAVEVSTDDRARLVLRGPFGQRSLDADEALAVFCAPRGARGPVEELEHDLGTPLSGLPLFPFAWGLDSI